MLTEDYLMRLLRLAVAALAKIAGLRAATLYVDALYEADQLLQMVTGFRANLLEQMDDAGWIAAVSGEGGVDPDRAVVVGDALREQAEIYQAIGSPQQAAWRMRRALLMYLEAGLAGEPASLPPVLERVEELSARIKLPELGPELLYPLFLYAGQADRSPRLALDALQRLLHQSGDSPELAAEGREYLQHLLNQADPWLEAHQLPREEVLAVLSGLNGHPSPG